MWWLIRCNRAVFQWIARVHRVRGRHHNQQSPELANIGKPQSENRGTIIQCGRRRPFYWLGVLTFGRNDSHRQGQKKCNNCGAMVVKRDDEDFSNYTIIGAWDKIEESSSVGESNPDEGEALFLCLFGFYHCLPACLDTRYGGREWWHIFCPRVIVAFIRRLLFKFIGQFVGQLGRKSKISSQT